MQPNVYVCEYVLMSKFLIWKSYNCVYQPKKFPCKYIIYHKVCCEEFI